MAGRRITGWKQRLLIGGAAALALASPAMADVKAGVDAWSAGDYEQAVALWQGPAQVGDPDALFNMGQAYRLGLGVPANPARAEEYYADAAEKGHVRAADTYGLMLFQSGRMQQALPYVQDAAGRGDPRARYLLGIAYFNGDLVPRDWVRAYALLTLANEEALPQAPAALVQMDQYITRDDRRRGEALAMEMKQQQEAAQARDLASFDLAALGEQVGMAPAPAAPAATPAATPRVPQPIRTAPVPPSTARENDQLAAARDAVRQAVEATGMESPAEAGADYARPAAPPAQVAAAQAPAAAPAARQPSTPAPAPARSQPAATGPWKIQLGAFGVAGNAERLWQQLSSRPELAGKNRLLVPSGGLTRLQAGGYATRAEAESACTRLKAAGQACMVIQ